MTCHRKTGYRWKALKKLLIGAIIGILVICFLIICVIGCQSKNSGRTITFCVPPASPKYGHVSIGSVVTRFSCNSGFKLNGSPVAVCVGGKWSTPVPQCISAAGTLTNSKYAGEMDIELKDQQVITAYTDFQKPSKINRSKSNKRKSRWKKRRRKGRRKKSKTKKKLISQPKKDLSGRDAALYVTRNVTQNRIRNKQRNKLSKKERRMKRRQDRKRKKKRRDRHKKKGKRKHRKKRKRIKDKRRNEIHPDKRKDKGDKLLNRKSEANSIHFDNLLNSKPIRHVNQTSTTHGSRGIHFPKLTTTSSPKGYPPSSNTSAGVVETTKSTSSENKNDIKDTMYSVYKVDAADKLDKVDIVTTQTPKSDLLQEIIDRMKTRTDNNESDLIDDYLTLKVENEMRNVRQKTSKNDVHSYVPEGSRHKKEKDIAKSANNYEDDYDPDNYLDYSSGSLGKLGATNSETFLEQELPVGYPSLEDRLFDRNNANAPRERFVEEEDIIFSELDTTCTVSDADSIYLPPPRVKNGYVTAYISVTNPAPPNNVYVEANYDCNFGFQLSEPTNSRLFCRESSWIGLLPKCVPYVIGDGVCGVENGGCQHICSPAANVTFTCSCYRGFTLDDDGISCKDVDECLSNNGDCDGACFNKLGSYQCYCPDGYQVATNGRSCVDRNECILRNGHGPCQDTCFNTEGSYYCTCDGRSGTLLSSDKHSCEDMDECAVNNGGCSHICLNTFGQTFCACRDGYTLTLDWQTCKDINECDYPDIAAKCDLGCINTVGSYRCAESQDLILEIECPDGEQLNHNGTGCEDIDECALDDNFGCSHLCVNTKGSAYCRCPPNYELQDAKTCVDINECTSSHECSHECANTDGSYECKCPTGNILSPDNITCIDLNECVHDNGGCGQLCVNLDGSHQCECQSGFVLMPDHTCEDIDECQQDNGDCEQVCTNEKGSFSCSCNTGFDSKGSICEDIDECDLNIAKCEQSCSNTVGFYDCLCFDGYELDQDGYSCKDVDECSNKSSCSHFCSNENGSFVCSCPAGWALAEDERTCTDIDECEMAKCSHGCQNTDGGYECTCPKGLHLIEEGTLNQKKHLCVDIDECSVNNGNCSHLCSNLDGSFECACPEGYDIDDYHGVSNCRDRNECDDKNGGCSHHCINIDGSFKCHCPTGLKLTKDGSTCEDIDECLIGNGGCSHTCINLPGTYECTCPAGWVMDIDYYTDYDSNEVYLEETEPQWKICTDLDECQVNNGGCSHECVNGKGNFHCSCPSGYNLINDYTCQDINECMVDTGPCSDLCINIPGSFRCECPNGFTLVDGKRCTDVNECLDESICSHDCVNKLGTYKCLCPSGFIMENDNKTCNDFNECGNSNGGCSHTCKNTGGHYTCSCPSGMILDADNHLCEDIDECEEQNGGCSHTCRNMIGSYLCSCPLGLMLSIESKTCLDVDECGKENGGCSHQCSNQEGHYTCLCPTGTELQSDGHTCQDIDECSSHNAGCSHKCYNIYGTYECLCPEGYLLKVDNHTCQDVDECTDRNGGCEENCYNTRGSFRCDCDRGYQLGSDLLSCRDIDECSHSNGGCSHFCENMPGTFLCSCPLGHNLKADGFQCVDVDECEDKPCEHNCFNTEGSFYCGCDEGYLPRPDSSDYCHDVNECELNNGECSHDCFNTIGSYYCGCPVGFKLTDNGYTCDEKKIFCLLMLAPLGSSMKCSSLPIGTAYKSGTKCSFFCEEGYALQGSNTSTCNSNGTWSDALPRCKDIHCPGMPNIEFGVISPYRCIQGSSKLNQHCYLTCNKGYKVVGNPVRTCKEPGIWLPTVSPHCIRDSLKPFIQCPKDMTVELSPHQSVAYVRLPRPKSNVEWYRFIDSSHDWAKELEADIPAGATVITFTAHSPLSDEKASCTFEVFVKDTEIPQVFGCPKSFKLYLTKDEDATEVTWKEPVFKDNVEIVHVYKSMEPGTKLQVGTYPVHYISVDPQGNRAKCSFVITVEEYHQLPDEPTHREPKNGSCGLHPGPIPGGMWVCNDWEWGRICKPNCPPSKVLINPSSNLLFMCLFSAGIWNPDATDIHSRPACSRSISVKRGLDCMLGYEREKNNQGACMACTPGMYRNKSFDRCVPCQVGFYTHTFGSSKCNQCPWRRTTTDIGTYSRSLCVRRPSYIKWPSISK